MTVTESILKRFSMIKIKVCLLMTDRKNRKRPASVVDLTTPDESALDFTDPNSTDILKVSDIEFVFLNGTLYANAAMLVNTCDFFKGVLVDTWQSTDRNDCHRCVYPMHEAKIGGPYHKEVMFPLLHLAYRNKQSCIKAIHSLFEEPKLFEEFMSFVDKIGWKQLHPLIHDALTHRPHHNPEIYPILKCYSAYGTKPNFLRFSEPTSPGLAGSTAKDERPVFLELSFFTNIVNSMVQRPPSFQIGMFDGLVDVEDVKFFNKYFCDPRVTTGIRIAALMVLLILDRKHVKTCLTELDLHKNHIALACQKAQVYKDEELMKTILGILSDMLVAKQV
jgi:hypothetical protein